MNFDEKLIQRDAEGVPVAWRLLAIGKNPLCKGGVDKCLEMTADDADAAVAYLEKKGGKIPLDSRHFIFFLSARLGVEESEVLRLLPDGRGTFGFGSLERRLDGLWLSDVEYVPLGRELMKQGVFRWFSPVCRGLDEKMRPAGDFRVTSVALENEPALNNLQAFAATSDEPENGLTLSAVETQIWRLSMKKVEGAIARMLKRDAIALESDCDSGELAAAIDEVTKTAAAALEQLAKIREKLKLPADAKPEAVEGAMAGLCARADQVEALTSRNRDLENRFTTEERDRLIAQGLAAKKLTNGMTEWAKKQSVAFLSSYLEVAPQVVPDGKSDPVPAKNAEALTANEDKIFSSLGLTAEEKEKAKKC